MFIEGDLSYAGISVVSVLSAGIGAFFGAYLKKKGENLATHEDLDNLVLQVKATTEATKAIEARITNDLWVSQKGWELKRDILMQWFRSVHDANEAAREASHLIDKLAQNDGHMDGWKKDLNTITERWSKSHANVRTLMMDVEAVAGEDLSNAEFAIRIHMRLIDALLLEPASTIESLKIAAATLSVARGTLKRMLIDAVVLIRRELGIVVLPPTSQSTGSSATQDPDSPLNEIRDP